MLHRESGGAGSKRHHRSRIDRVLAGTRIGRWDRSAVHPSRETGTGIAPESDPRDRPYPRRESQATGGANGYEIWVEELSG